MSLEDLKNSELDLSQSRTTYKVKLKSNPDTPLGKSQIEQIQEYARENKWRFDDASNGPNNFVRGLASVTTFIGIITSVALFLIVVNIIANLTYFITKFRKTIALLMTFGATGRQIQSIYIGILAIVGGVAGAMGSLLGAIGANI